MKYRLGLDLGSTSLGWCVYDVEKDKPVTCGVRIFDDGREADTKQPLCVKRREVRGARRLCKRRTMKMQTLLNCLIQIGLFPANVAEQQALKDLNPYKDMHSDDPKEMEKIKVYRRMPLYALRAKALDEKLSLYELGRVLLQLGQRKGFLSNRKDSSDSGGKLKAGNEKLQNQIKEIGARTYGEYLYLKHLKNPSASIRLKCAFDDKKELQKGVEFPYRAQYKEEFDAIWDKQREFYPNELNDENKEKIEFVLFFQRPLKEPEIGFCRLESGERRIAKAHPLFQEFRIWQHVNNLKIDGESLDADQKSQLYEALSHPASDSEKLSYAAMRKLLRLDNKRGINYEGRKDPTANEKGIIVNTTELAINKQVSEEVKKFWHKADWDTKCNIILLLDRPKAFFESKQLADLKIEYSRARTIEGQNNCIAKYLRNTYGFSEQAAYSLLEAPFENDYGHLSEKAINKILSHMKEGLRYDEACEKVGYKHSQSISKKMDKLPYYGEILKESCLGAKENPKNDEEKYGKISNATVHVALNQVRAVVNELITRYGKPSDISIEYARDLNASAEQRKHITNIQEQNRKENERIRQKIREAGESPSEHYVQKYKIWESMGSLLKRICPYTGKEISITDLLSARTEIDHILPFSRTFDDSINNKVICFADANRTKGERTPYEAFCSSDDWRIIAERAKKFDKQRRWRFSKDAMKTFQDRGTPISRALNDTRYMTRVLQQYLLSIIDEKGMQTVQAVPGKLTAIVRSIWGLNDSKDKADPENYRTKHYHHAIDALVIAALNRVTLQDINTKLGKISSQIQEEVDKAFEGKDLDDPEVTTEVSKFIYGRQKKILAEMIVRPSFLNDDSIKNSISEINISHKGSAKNIRDDTSTVGELHKDTAYGLHSLSDTNLNGCFHVTNENKTVDITSYVPIFRNIADRDAYYDVYKEWFISEGKSRLVKAKTKQEKELKANLKEVEDSAKQKLKSLAQKAFKWFVSGNNYCMTVYEINSNNKIKGMPTTNRGEWEAEVVSNYNATLRARRGESISYLPYRWPTSKKLMELRINDMVVATFTREEIDKLSADDRIIETEGSHAKVTQKGTIVDGCGPAFRAYLKSKIGNNSEVTILFRVKKIKASGTIFLIPHDIANELSADDTCWSCTVTGLQNHNVKKVRVSPSGIKYA